MKNSRILDTVMQTLAPAHTRRRRQRAARSQAPFAVFSSLSTEGTTTPADITASAAQLQAAYHARCAEETRSALC